MNILGEGFPEEIIKQVEQRQKVYGSGYTSTPRSSKEIIYLNANTSWCKLVSSVNVDNPKIIQDESLRNLGNAIKDNKLAKQFVLFNGVNNYDAGDNQRAGIALNQNILGNNNAYGIGGTEFGLRPMMGIKSARIKHENRGSIRRATLQIKAFNRSQFDIIDVLYLRLGFNVLLEWGHSMYYQNNGTFVSNPTDNSLAEFFLDGKGGIVDYRMIRGGLRPIYKSLDYLSFLDLIQKQRIKSQGNYDAMFAKVVNFHWSFLKDGSYDITLDLVSVGDVVESFKVNTLVDWNIESTNKVDDSKDPKKDLSEQNAESVIAFFADKHSIGQYFYKLQQNPVREDFIEITSKDSAYSAYYVRLGAFLKFLEKDLMYKIKTSSNSNTQPALNFDYDVSSNLMFIEPLQVSVDPDICLVNRTLQIESQNYTFTPDNAELFESPDLGEKYGQIMNIYINMKWVLFKLDELKDANTNKVTLINFLNSILSGINSSLGGINKLEPTVDEVKNILIIRDANPLPKTEEVIKKLNDKGYDISNKYVRFDLYGYNVNAANNESHASFIKDFSFKTEITPELSTMLTVGATANSTVVGENSTALSKFNIGLTDRFKEKITYSDSEDEIKEGTDLYKSLYQKYAQAFNSYGEYLTRISTQGNYKFDKEEPNTYKDALVNYTTYLQQARQTQWSVINKNREKANQNPLPSPYAPSTGFIPFNMSLTMDGLSGMKIYNKFLIDVDFLPANYPDNAEFLIKNIEHTIEDNKWFTTLESIVISKGEEGVNDIKKTNISINGQSTSPTPQQWVGGNTPPVDDRPSVLFDREFAPLPLRNPSPISVADLVKRLHPQVQSTFTNFFNDVLQNSPGYDITINETYRSFARSAELQKDKKENASPGSSPHNYGYAIDLNLKNRKTGKTYQKTTSGTDWLLTGFVDIAAKYGIKWGDFPNYADRVHFYIDFDRKATLANVKKTYPNFNPNDISTTKNIDGRKVKVV